MKRTRRFNGDAGRAASVVLAVVVAATSCASEAPSDGGAGKPVMDSTGVEPSSSVSSAAEAPTLRPTAGAASVFTVPAGAAVCNESLSFSVPGCACNAPASQACWTGPQGLRNVGACHDGVQTCRLSGEFGSWGPCEGEELSCGGDAGTPTEAPELVGSCPCIPGTTIGCSEDCEALIICSLSGYKTCLPDGTWGPCRETRDISGALENLLGCRSLLHGCFPGNEAGIYSGDCSQAFTCGHAP